jgi:hypothetical protein
MASDGPAEFGFPMADQMNTFAMPFARTKREVQLRDAHRCVGQVL